MKRKNEMLSVVIPAYNEASMISRTATVVSEILNKADIDNEILFVDDGSMDETWLEIQKIKREIIGVKGVRFSRNFGKEAAVMAGMTKARGECCVIIDCDLQHPPEKIIEMYQLWEKGYEIVEGRKSSRGKEGIIHKLFAKFFYALISKAVGIDMSNASDFKLMDRKVVDVLIQMREKHAFFRALSSWVGFKTTQVFFDVQDRECGESKWSTLALIKYALNNISSFSYIPMQIVTLLGSIMFIISSIFGGIAVIQKLCGEALEGFTTVILLIAFSSSIIMISLGIIGYYIAKMYDELKDRPRYIIAEYV